ncbi:unnamed protein product [Calicophoron daubneyi]|uniref:MARVEL domain-containing protein n=1 Tax=Calicophoron daubneyi TaxID=300641 RepID=A0AAV2THZ8_CALDB
MAIRLSHPQVILYWTELLISILCVALAGRGYNETYIRYLIIISTALALGNIAFLLIYGFATLRPPQGRSVTKLVETIYQAIAAALYCAGIGASTVQQEYLQPFIGAITVFTSFGFGAYIFGGLIAATELIWSKPTEHPSDEIQPKQNDSQVSGL